MMSNFYFSRLNIKNLSAEISGTTDVKIAGRLKPFLIVIWDPMIDNKRRLKMVQL